MAYMDMDMDMGCVGLWPDRDGLQLGRHRGCSLGEGAGVAGGTGVSKHTRQHMHIYTCVCEYVSDQGPRPKEPGFQIPAHTS